MKETYRTDPVEIQKMYLSGGTSTEGLYTSKNPLENYMQMCRHVVVKSLLKKYSAKCKNVIDVGCGAGVYLNYLEKDLNTVGIDLNRSDLKKAVENSKYAKYIQASAEGLPFKGNLFDLVLFSETLEHLPNPIKSLEEIHQILKEKGLLLISIPSKRGIYEIKEFVYVSTFLKGISRLFRGESFKTPFEEHISLQTPGELKMKLEDCGFEIMEEFYTGFCVPLAGDVLRVLLRYRHGEKIYDKINKFANKSKLLRDYNWSMIFVCKKV